MVKVAILGPESTGKTALAETLAHTYDSPWIPEYAREYIENINRPYTFEDICIIAHKQVEQEKLILSGLYADKQFVFFDTELIITKVWFEYCYKTIPAFVTNQLNTCFFDVYLLCAPDLDWEADKVREHGNDRDFFFEWYRREIENLNTPYVVITGKGQERIQNAHKAIAEFCAKTGKKYD